MTMTVTPPRAGLPLMPADLNARQRGVLAVVVLLAHALVAVAVWCSPAAPVVPVEPVAIEVALISEHSAPEVPQTQPVSPPAEAVPAVPKAAPPATKPMPPMPAPPVLASTKPAQTTDMQVPVPAPESKPPSGVLPTPPSVSNSVPAPQPTHDAELARPARPTGSATQPRTLPSSAVRYLVKPVLNYPRASRELGESGEVVLKVLVDEQGRPKEIELTKSSGFPRLDQQAIQAMKAARFQPLIEEGVARVVWVTPGPLIFNLEEQ